MNAHQPSFKPAFNVRVLLTFILSMIGLTAFSFQTELIQTECAEHERFNRFESAIACAEEALSGTNQDSLDRVFALTVLARVQDEFYDYWKSDSLYLLALEAFPNSKKKTALYAELLREVGIFHFMYYEPKPTIKYLRQAENTWNEKNSFHSILLALASIYQLQENVDSSNYYLAKAESIIDSNDVLLMARYHTELGRFHYDQSDYIKAVPQFISAISYYRSLPDNSEKADLFFLIGDTYAEAGNNVRAINYYRKSLNIYRQIGSPELANNANTLGWVFYNTRQFDSALVYLNKTLDIYTQTCPKTTLRAYPLGNLGLVYYELDSLQAAEEFSNAAMDLYHKMGFLPGVAEGYNNLGRVYLKQGQIEKSKLAFEKAFDVVTNEWSDPKELMNSCLGLSQIAKYLGNYESALGYMETATHIKDSLSNIQLATKIISDEINNNAAVAENRIHQLEIEKAENSIELKKSQYALLAICITLIIVLISSVVISVSWKQRQTAIKKQTEVLNINQEIIRMISHDFRGPMNNIRVLMELLRSNEMTRADFDEISEVVYNQTCEISLMFETFVGWALSQSDNYRPKTEFIDWSDTIEGVVNLLTPLAAIKNLTLVVENKEDFHLRTDRIAAQLVLRNLVSNAIKFSHENTNINIHVSENNGVLLTQVRDEGVGMDAERLSELFANSLESRNGTENEVGSGLGLKMALKFAELNGGRIDVKSELGKGSTFTYRLPIMPPSA